MGSAEKHEQHRHGEKFWVLHVNNGVEICFIKVENLPSHKVRVDRVLDVRQVSRVHYGDKLPIRGSGELQLKK